MKRKAHDSEYYDWQNKRSVSHNNANTITQYFQFLGVDVTPDFYFLDVGCRSHAHTVSWFRSLGAHSYGFDIGELAEKSWGPNNLNLKRHDAHEPFDYNFQFDLISISHALEHCYDPEKVLKNIYDSLKPQGKVWGIVPIEKPTDNHEPHYTNFHSHEEHIKMYNDNGFEVIFDYDDEQTPRNSNILAVKK